MGNQANIARQYSSGGLLDRFCAAMKSAGIDPDRPSFEEINGGDEFHIGGAEATQALLDPLGITEEMHVLDIGAGVGGPARLAAHHYGCRVTGVDLTPEFVETAKALTDLLAMSGRVAFLQGSGTELPLDDASVDLAMMLHVGMNIEDKRALFGEVARVLVPGGRFAVYDIMDGADPAPLRFPMPWARTPDASFVAPREDYLAAAKAAGLTLDFERNRWEYGVTFMKEMGARAQRDGPPPMGPHLFMGETARERLGNVLAELEARSIAPVEMVFGKPGS